MSNEADADIPQPARRGRPKKTPADTPKDKLPAKRQPTPTPKIDEDVFEGMPDRITAEWVRKQLPASVWRDHKQALKPAEISAMARDAKKGISKRAILGKAGYHVSSWDRWTRLAAEQNHPVYTLWYKVMIASISSVEEELMDSIRAEAMGDWRAAKWLLEQLNKDEYTESKTTNININREEKVSINTITDSDAIEMARILQEIGAVPDIEDAEVVEDD